MTKTKPSSMTVIKEGCVLDVLREGLQEPCEVAEGEHAGLCVAHVRVRPRKEAGAERAPGGRREGRRGPAAHPSVTRRLQGASSWGAREPEFPPHPKLASSLK